MEKWLENVLGDESSQIALPVRLLIIAGIVIAAYLIDFFCARCLVPMVKKLTKKTRAQWDDILLSGKVVRGFCNILPPLVLTFALPLLLSGKLEDLLLRCCAVYIIVIIIRFLCILISAIYDYFCVKNGAKVHSLKGIAQTIKIIFCVIGVILSVSTLIDKSPVFLISGLGAMAAVLMLVFQDSIKGLVAGVQLSANDMMRPGDWISLPKCNADGVVIDVTLNTVKVRNWDNTIITIPPYMLVNDSFQNWRGMSESGGRRITRSLNIDMHSIRFCTQEEIRKYVEQGFLPPDAEEGVATNLQAYRSFLLRYLRHHPEVNSELSVMVRQLAPAAEGLPLQIYCFSRSKVWVEYEDLQSRLIEFLAASLPDFGLYVYQRTSAYDSVLTGGAWRWQDSAK